ncbi:MAG: hypothetical protein EOP54_01805 [Sphingobacteriales bacterium]|nr:MAG: hypothetical protein EOP54_01805 [Sphingobacteriales bacterium]
MNQQAENFFAKPGKWQAAYNKLRNIIQKQKELEEEYKWMHPCYTLEGKNTVLIHGFKDYCALLFHKGALMRDPEGILIRQTENVQSARQLRFRNIDEITNQEAVIKAYIKEAIAIEKSGKKVMLKEVAEYPVPEEFNNALAEDSSLHIAFYALSPGRQKGYLFYFNQAKQSATRTLRIEKYYQHILNGKGIDDPE